MDISLYKGEDQLDQIDERRKKKNRKSSNRKDKDYKTETKGKLASSSTSKKGVVPERRTQKRKSAEKTKNYADYEGLKIFSIIDNSFIQNFFVTPFL